MENFKKQLAVSLITAFLVVVMAIVATQVIVSEVTKRSAKIESQKQELALRTQATGFLAALKADFEKAKPLFDTLANVLPPKDDLINLGREMSDLGKRLSVELTFNFGPEAPSVAGKPASIGFSINGAGSYDNIVRFLKEIEKSPLYIKVNSIDLTAKADNKKFGLVLSGEVFYQ